MDAIHFTTVIGPDGVIRPPSGVILPQGEIQVAVRPAVKPVTPTQDELTMGWALEIVAEIEKLNPDLPSDMAENHDYYAHGKPKK